MQNALHGLGWDDVDAVRVGRVIEFDLTDADAAAARTRVEAMCQRLLANPVIEGYRVDISA